MHDKGRYKKSESLNKNLEDLFVRFYQSVYRAAFFIVKDRGLAEDAAQETFVKAHRSLGRLRDWDKAEAWLTRIAMNSARDLLRRRKRIVVSLQRDLPDSEDPHGPEQALLALEEKEAVWAALLELGPKYQDVVYLKYYRELTTRQISAFLEIPEGTVKTRLRKARLTIASKLETAKNKRISG